jgi:hypothetical protein
VVVAVEPVVTVVEPPVVADAVVDVAAELVGADGAPASDEVEEDEGLAAPLPHEVRATVPATITTMIRSLRILLLPKRAYILVAPD